MGFSYQRFNPIYLLVQILWYFKTVNSLKKIQYKKSFPFEIVYGIQPRGIIELRDLNQDEFRSAGAEDFETEMQKLHDRVREQLHNNS